MSSEELNEFKLIRHWFYRVGLVLLILFLLCLYSCPKYNVWEQGLTGQAELARAIQNRQIAVQEAEAKKDSAKALADAEILRAEGVAKANLIIGDSLKGNEDYLRYLWIHNLEEAQSKGTQIIYVPTEANLPILEANRNKK